MLELKALLQRVRPVIDNFNLSWEYGRGGRAVPAFFTYPATPYGRWRRTLETVLGVNYQLTLVMGNLREGKPADIRRAARAAMRGMQLLDTPVPRNRSDNYRIISAFMTHAERYILSQAAFAHTVAMTAKQSTLKAVRPKKWQQGRGQRTRASLAEAAASQSTTAVRPKKSR